MGNCFKKSHDIPISLGSSDDTPPPQQFPKSTQGRFSPTPSERATLSSSSSSSFPVEPTSLEDELGKILSKPYVDINSLYVVEKELGRGQFGGAYEDKQNLHLVMELCTGGELFDRSINKGNFSEREATLIGRQIVNVVHVCHFIGVMHRDLKPESFLMVKVSDLEGKVVGLYFSANWYPPCRNFTPVLVDMYEQIKTKGSNFEIVYVSSDEDLNAFNNYHALMPGLAIPFSDLETKKALNRKFDIEGIPCLVILQPNNNKDDATLHEGVELVYQCGVRVFPYTKQRLENLLEEERKKHERQTLTNLITNHDRDYLLGHPSPKQVPVASLVGKTVGTVLLCPMKIKQMLVENGDHEDFEIVFVSNDRNQESFDSYFNTMPWLALPFGDPTVKELAKHFDLRGIPCLIIIGPHGKTVTKQGRNLINLYQENAYPFTEAKVELLEKQMDEEAKSLPRSVYHPRHRHELNLVS
nr:putative nucleoredoxin 2 [Quercus suber]